MNSQKMRVSNLPATLIAGLACSVNAHAVDVFWTGKTDANLSTTTNWFGEALPTAGATLVFDLAEMSGASSFEVKNDLTSAPVYNALKFSNGGFTVKGINQITLQPVSTNLDVITNLAGSNTISAPLRIETNSVDRILSTQVLDSAQISVGSGSLKLEGAVTAGQVNLTTNLNSAGGSSLTMHDVSAKSFTANWGTQNLLGALNSSTVSLVGTNFTVGGAGGAINATVGTSMGSESQLTLDNTAMALSDRLSGKLTMAAGTTLLLKGNATTGVANNAGVLTITGSDAALTHIKLEGAGANASITFGSLTSNGLVNFASSGTLGGAEQIKLGVTPTLTNGLMSRALVNGHEFATYNAAKGVVAATTATTLSGATAADHVYISATENWAGNSAINSLAVNNAVINGTGAISLASGKLLTNGVVSIAPAINFGSSAGEIINIGTTVLAGGVNGSNGLSVLGNGSLELANAGNVTGAVTYTGQLVLSANNALQGADLSGSISIDSTTGGTYQSVNSFSGSVISNGGGWIVAANDIRLSQDVALVNLQGKNVYVSSNSFYGNISGSQAAQLSGNIYGVISGFSNVSSYGATFHGQNTYTGNTMGSLTLDGHGSIKGSVSFSGDRLSIISSSLYLANNGGALDRIGNSAAVSLTGSGTLSLLNQNDNATLYEDIGVLNISGTARLELHASGLAGTTSLRANALNLASGSELTMSLDAASSFYVDAAPGTYTGTNVVKDVYVEKIIGGTVIGGTLIGGKLLPSWAAYDAGTGRISEALVIEKALNSAGSNEFVRVTDAANQALTTSRIVGGVNVDTIQTMSGSGTLTVGSGQLLFWKANTINIANLNFDTKQGVVTNAGTNTIASVIAGSNGLLKKGDGTLVLTANNTYTGTTQVAQGILSVASGGRIGDVSVGGNAQLDLAGTAKIVTVSSYGTVNLNTAYTNAAGNEINNIGSVYVNAGLTNQGTINGGGFIYANAGLTNQGTIYGIVNNAGSVVNSGHIDTVQNHVGFNGSLVNNAGASIGTLRYGSATSFTNVGTVSSLYNTGTVINNGTVNHLSNNGTFTNNGTLVLDGASLNGTVINAGTAVMNTGSSAFDDTYTGIYTQTAGTTTINGDLHSDVLLQGGILKGTGAVFGNVTVSNGAQVKPGNSPGQLMVNGNFTLESGSVLNLEVLNINGILEYDQLIVSGSFTKNGQIKFDLGTDVIFNGSSFASAGQTVTLADMFSLNQLSGLVGNEVSVADANGGLQSWTIAADDIPTPVPEPETYAMMLAGLGLVGWAARRRRA